MVRFVTTCLRGLHFGPTLPRPNRGNPRRFLRRAICFSHERCHLIIRPVQRTHHLRQGRLYPLRRGNSVPPCLDEGLPFHGLSSPQVAPKTLRAIQYFSRPPQSRMSYLSNSKHRPETEAQALWTNTPAPLHPAALANRTFPHASARNTLAVSKSLPAPNKASWCSGGLI